MATRLTPFWPRPATTSGSLWPGSGLCALCSGPLSGSSHTAAAPLHHKLKRLNSLFHRRLVYTSDLELGETVNMVLAEVERVRPSRVVFDSLSEIRLLSQGSLRYRRQVLALKHFFLLHNATVLLLDDLTAHEDDLNLHSLLRRWSTLQACSA